MSINIYSSIYIDPHAGRNSELLTCIRHNKESGANLIHLDDNVKRATYLDFFNKINETTGNDDINIIANSDIYFKPEDLDLIEKNLNKNQCYALCRWDVITDREPLFLNRWDAQDSWCFRGQVRPVRFSEFYLGKPGCDNRIAYELKQAGYDVLNPSKTIRSYHLHNSGIRNYISNRDQSVPKPYLCLTPCEL